MSNTTKIVFYELMYDEDHETSFYPLAQNAIDDCERIEDEGSCCVMQCVLTIDSIGNPLKLTKNQLCNTVDGEFELTSIGEAMVDCQHDWLISKLIDGDTHKICKLCLKHQEI